MIKPIIYHSFEEKAILEKEMMAKIPSERRKAISKALMALFYKPEKVHYHQARRNVES